MGGTATGTSSPFLASLGGALDNTALIGGPAAARPGRWPRSTTHAGRPPATQPGCARPRRTHPEKKAASPWDGGRPARSAAGLIQSSDLPEIEGRPGTGSPASSKHSGGAGLTRSRPLLEWNPAPSCAAGNPLLCSAASCPDLAREIWLLHLWLLSLPVFSKNPFPLYFAKFFHLLLVHVLPHSFLLRILSFISMLQLGKI